MENDHFADVVTSRGCVSAGLLPIYPVGDDGTAVGWERCPAVGQEAWDAGQPGIACRSAAEGAPARGEELAWFCRQRRLTPLERRPFGEWYGQIDWV